MAISLKSDFEIAKIERAGQILAGVLKGLKELVRPKVTPKELERWIEAQIIALGARPAFKGYRGFPAAACISVDEVVVHGIPDSRSLREGQIVGVDIGVEMDGFYADGAYTFKVGSVSKEVERLLQVTERALYRGIERAQPGARLSDISHEIEEVASGAGFWVVRELVGHGVGFKLHEEPQIPNFGPPGEGPKLRPGMVLAIEPMVNMGSARVHIISDGWTVVTDDGLPSAHFEHTIAITQAGPKILTQWPVRT
jgi:methionyl aminopeptidase